MRKVRRGWICFLVAIVLFGCTAGCSSGSVESDEATGNSTEGNSDGAPSVGLILVGNINDGGWNASAYNGLMQIEEQLGAETAYAENVKISDMAEVMRSFASEGYQYVIGHGFECFDPAKLVAPDFQDTRFIVNSCSMSSEPNVAGLNVDNRHHGFLAGVVAARLTESKVIGIIGGMNIPSIADFVDSAKLGVAYVDPEIEMLETYTGSFDDVSLAKEISVSMIEQGADVLLPEVSQADLGVYEAATELGIVAIGSTTDRYSQFPECIPTSVTMNMSLAMSVLVSNLEDGTMEWSASPYKMGIKHGITEILEPQGIWMEKFPEDDYKYCKRVEQAMIEGILNIDGINNASELPVIE